MTDIHAAEFERIINSVALSADDKTLIAERIIKSCGNKNMFSKKHAAAAGIAVAIAAGFFIPYVRSKTR